MITVQQPSYNINVCPIFTRDMTTKLLYKNWQDFLGTMYINLVSTAREVDDKEEEEERMEQLHGQREDND